MPENTCLPNLQPIDPSKSVIENAIEITALSEIEPNLFTNSRPLWRPRNARGVYGGTIIAQCLAAAYKTVPDDFDVHSLHCYFVIAGDSKIPIIYHVQLVRDGKSFALRTVQAKQHGKCIFTTTISFVRENSGGKFMIQHALSLPEGTQIPTDDYDSDMVKSSQDPFITQHEPVSFKRDQKIPEKKVRHWVKARGVISEAGGHQAHLAALTYISDSYFLGTVTVIHDLYRFPNKKGKGSRKKLIDDYETQQKPSNVSQSQVNKTENADKNSKSPFDLGMVVTLDHTIYFHEPRGFRADEWILSEMSSPWSGDGRGVVVQHMFSANGKLIATCHQEGILRLNEARLSRDFKL